MVVLDLVCELGVQEDVPELEGAGGGTGFDTCTGGGDSIGFYCA